MDSVWQKQNKEKKYTKKTVSRKLNSIKSLFRFLKDNGVVTEDPSLRVAHPKVSQKPPRILSSLAYRALRDACRNDNRAYAIVELMLQAGLRISEVANLELNDITENTIIVRAYESHPQRVVPLNRAAKEAVRRYIENDRPKTNRTKKINIYTIVICTHPTIYHRSTIVYRAFACIVNKNTTANP